MGDYSRDPFQRLADAAGKRYVGVRMQQGVPVLDADLNVMDDIRRHEHETVNTWVVGDGVPVGSNGFRIVPIVGGGENTLVIDAVAAAPSLSQLLVDTAASSAAAALGFNAFNSSAARDGTSPARLVGDRVQPFALADGNTLTLRVDDGAPATVAFHSTDFADITAATAAEVCAVINAATSAVAATPGAGNDFIVRGGGSQPDRGCIMVAGQITFNERDIKYSQQPLFSNTGLAQRWGVDPLAPLSEPVADRAYIAFIDVWNREVNSTEDEDLVDTRIGIETTLGLRREWAVRVVPEPDFPSVLAARPARHAYYPLALLQRPGGVRRIDADMISDLRATDVSVRREVAFRSVDDVLLVDTAQFRDLLIDTRDTVYDFINFLTTKFLAPDASYMAAEVMGLDALSAIAAAAEQGVALANAEALGTRGAVRVLEQLVAAENRFVSRWRESVLPLNKPAVGTIYATAFTEMIDRIDGYLFGPPPGGFVTVPDALAAQDLYEAVRSQERINVEFGRELERPVGVLNLTYLGSTAPTIVRNTRFDIRYRVEGSVTPEDVMRVQVFIDPAWTTIPRNANGSIPFDLHLGPGEDDAEFLISVTPPDVAAASSTFSVLIYADGNSGGLRHISTQKALTIGATPPASEEAFAMRILTTNLSQTGGVFHFTNTVPGKIANMSFELSNNTSGAINVDINFLPSPPPAGWTIIAPPPGDRQNVAIPAHGAITRGFSFMRPSAAGQTLEFTLRVVTTGTSSVVGETQVSFVTVGVV